MFLFIFIVKTQSKTLPPHTYSWAARQAKLTSVVPDPNLCTQAALQNTQNIDSEHNNKKILLSLIGNKNIVIYKTSKSVQIFSNVGISIQRTRGPLTPFSGASEAPAKPITLNLLVIFLS